MSNRSCLAEKTKVRPNTMRKTEDLQRICGGVDLHKMQFTVLSEQQR